MSDRHMPTPQLGLGGRRIMQNNCVKTLALTKHFAIINSTANNSGEAKMNTMTIKQIIELARINLHVSDLQDGEEEILLEEATAENMRTLYERILNAARRKEMEKETARDHWLVTSGLQTCDQWVHEIFDDVRRLSDAAEDVIRAGRILGFEVLTAQEIEACQLPQ